MDDNLYAPPSQQELDDTKLYAAPTKEELESTDLHKKTAIEKLGSWAGHKVGGVVDWAGDTVKSGVNKGDDLLDMYTKGITLGKAPQIGAYLQSKVLPAIGIGENVTGLTEEEANKALVKISPGEIKLAKKEALQRGQSLTDEQAMDFIKKYGKKATISRPTATGGVETNLATEDANKAYERALAEEKQRYEQTAERSGILGAGAELAGNLLATELVAAPIAGVVGKALPSSIKYLKPAESIFKVAKNQGKLSAAGTALARMGARAGVDSLSGAAIGGIEHGTPEGAISGGITGAVFGAASPIVGDVLGATAGTLGEFGKRQIEKLASQKNPFAAPRWMAQDFLYGLKNKVSSSSDIQRGLTSRGIPSNVEMHANAARDAAQTFYDEMKAPLDKIADQMSDALYKTSEKMQEKGRKINISEGIDKFKRQLIDLPFEDMNRAQKTANTATSIIDEMMPQVAGKVGVNPSFKRTGKELSEFLKNHNIDKNAQNAIQDMINNVHDPVAYHSALKDLNEVIGAYKNKGENVSLLSSIEKQLQSALEVAVPDFEKHSSRYHQYLNNTFEPILDSFGDYRYYNQLPAGTRDKEMVEKIQQMLIGRSNTSGTQAQGAIRRLLNQADKDAKLGEGSLFKLHEAEKQALKNDARKNVLNEISAQMEQNKDNPNYIKPSIKQIKNLIEQKENQLLEKRVIGMPFQKTLFPENPRKSMSQEQFNEYIDRLSDQLGETSDKLNRMIYKTNQKASPLTGKNTQIASMFTGGVPGTAQSWALHSAEAAGRATTKANELFNSWSKFPDEKLNAIADSYISGNAALSKIPGAKALASALKTSIETGNSRLKNQVLYALVHNYGDFINEPETPQQ